MLRRPRGYRRERRAGSRGKGGGGGGSNDDVSGEEEEEASPNEMLVAATEALSSLQFSIEHKRKAQEDDWEDAMARDLEDTALSLLEILRRTLPYAAHRANNSGALLAHQFSALSQLLRMFVVLGRTMPSLSFPPRDRTPADQICPDDQSRGRVGHAQLP